MAPVIAAPESIDHSASGRAFEIADAAWLLGAVVSVALMIGLRWASLRSAPERPVAFAASTGFLLLAAMFLAGPITLRLLATTGGLAVPETGADAAPLDVETRAKLGLAHYAAQGVLALVYVVIVSRAAGRRPDRRFAIGRATLLGLAAIVLTWPIVSAGGGLAATAFQLLGGPAPDTIAHDTLRAIAGAPVDAWMLVLYAQIIIAAPALEEVFYRGLLQESLRRAGAGPWPAIVLSSVLFAWMHWQNTAPHAVVALFVLSLGFGWSYERGGRLISPIVMHAAFNLGNLAIARLTF